MSAGSKIDPITAEVIRCGLFTIANEMGDTMIRTARTSTFSESHDFSNSIFDWQGRLVSLSDGLPIHMGASKFSIIEALKDFKDDLHPGDLIIVNDPYHGGSHIPDWTMMAPIFVEEQLVFFPVTRAHQGDTGGAVPGGYNPGATDIWQEGLRLPPIKIYDRGKPRRDVIKMLQINTREPRFIGDFEAMMGSVRVGERRLKEMLEKYGAQTLLDCLDYILNYSERRFRAEIKTWPDGVFEGEAYLEHDCQGNKDITVRVKVTVSGDSLVLDFTGSDPQTAGFINSSIPNTYSYIFLTLSTMIDDSIPRNDGLFNPVNIILPENSVVNPSPPAPCTACTLHIGGEVGEAVAVALEKAIPEKAYIQNIKLGMPVVTYGTNPDSGEFYIDQNVNTSAGWCSAAHGVDGWGSMPCFFGAMTQATAELHEIDYPILTVEREYITDSGGPGKWRGGLGTRVIQKATAPAFIHTYLIGTKYPMRGFNGGSDGSPNRFVLRSGTPHEMIIRDTAFGEPVSNGHLLSADLGGGGGWGDPLERDAAAVLEDVLDEYVSLEKARNSYGVVIDPDHLTVDEKATANLRAKIAQKRADLKQEDVKKVRYLSPEWQDLCQKAINHDEEFSRLAGDMTMENINIIEDCPDQKTRYLYWRFEKGKLMETEVALIEELKDKEPLFTTIATYDTFRKINTAKLNTETAVMEGLVKLEGDMVEILKYAGAMNHFTEVRRTIPTEY